MGQLARTREKQGRSLLKDRHLLAAILYCEKTNNEKLTRILHFSLSAINLYHSVRKFFTGFITATFIACRLIVIEAINNARNHPPITIQIVKGTL